MLLRLELGFPSPKSILSTFVIDVNTSSPTDNGGQPDVFNKLKVALGELLILIESIKSTC